MNKTTAFTIFVNAVVRELKIPFEIAASETFYSETNVFYHFYFSLVNLSNSVVKLVTSSTLAFVSSIAADCCSVIINVLFDI